MIFILATRACPETLSVYQQDWGRPPGTRLKVLFYDDLPGRMFLPAATYVFSGLERLGVAGRALAAEVWRQLGDNGCSLRVNDPRRVPRRGELLAQLCDSGQNHFRVFSAGADLSPLRYPALLQSVGDGTRGFYEVVENATTLRYAIWKALLLGYSKRELLVVERGHTGDPHGVFRRYTADVVGERVFARDLRHSFDPDFGGVAADEPCFRRERDDFLASNPHREALLKIFREACIEFGSVDYSLDGDQIQVWEMRCNLRSPDMSPALTETLESIDTPGHGADTSLRFNRELVKRYAAERRSFSRRGQMRTSMRSVYSFTAPFWRELR